MDAHRRREHDTALGMIDGRQCDPMCLDIDSGEDVRWCDRLYILYDIDDDMIDVCVWFDQSMVDHIDDLSDSLVCREYSWWDEECSLSTECTQENTSHLC